jgi:hypothetical protein
MTVQESQQQPHWTDNLRSIVRPIVTLLVISALLGLFGYAIVHLLKNDVKSALGLLSGLGALASGIIGFWFGTRGKGGVFPEAGESGTDTAPGLSTEGILLMTPLSAAKVGQLRAEEFLPVTAQDTGPPARELCGNAAVGGDGTLLFHFMDECIDGRLVQLAKPVSASLPADTQSVAVGTALTQ